MQKVIEVNGLVKQFSVKDGSEKKRICAVNDISFDVSRGQVFGILGPNGAGKTTTLKILSTLLTPTSGEVRILGSDVVKGADSIRHSINFMLGGEKGVYNRLTALEYITYFACLYKVPRHERKKRCEALIDRVGLSDKANVKISTYSRGMKQRLHIARSLINNPEVLFLDEPTIGLDPVIAEHLRDIILDLRKNGITIVLSTHYMKEADELCDQIAIINSGVIKSMGTPKSIKESCGGIQVFEVMGLLKAPLESLNLNDTYNWKISSLEGNYKLIRIRTSKSLSVDDLRATISDAVDIVSLVKKETDLEDAYIELVKGVQ